MSSLKQKTITGVLWSTFERFSVQGIQFIFQIIIARILTPAEYGIVGMLAIFMAVSQTLVDSGFSNALIQKGNRSESDFSTIFLFNLLLSIFIYGILFFCAPAIAGFYKLPALTDIARIYFLTIPIAALGSIQRVIYTINVDFKRLANVTFFSAVFSGIVGLILALLGFGVWALVVSTIASSFVNSMMLWWRSKWRLSVKVSLTSIRTMYAFGFRLMLSGLLNTLYKNLTQLFIGKKFSAADLGLYSRANQLAAFPSSNITAIFSRVTYPILCDETLKTDDKKLKDAYQKIIKLSMFVVFPLMIGLAAVANPLILLLLSKKWRGAIPLLQILSVAMMWYPVHALNLNVLMVKGRSDLFLRLEIIKKVIGIVIILITVNISVIAMCYGMVINSLISLTINNYYTAKLLKYGIREQLKDISLSFFLSSIMGIAVYLICGIFKHNSIALICGLVSGVAIYLLLSLLFQKNEIKEIAIFWNTISKKKPYKVKPNSEFLNIRLGK